MHKRALETQVAHGYSNWLLNGPAHSDLQKLADDSFAFLVDHTQTEDARLLFLNALREASSDLNPADYDLPYFGAAYASLFMLERYRRIRYALLRIPANPAGRSGPIRPVIPAEIDQSFRKEIDQPRTPPGVQRRRCSE